MKIDNIGGYRSIPAFVRAKLDRFAGMERTFGSLYEMMFSERDNILYEKSVGYRIEKTTYGESRAHIEQKAARLSARLSALPADGVVGLYMDNSLDWIETFWAILRAGFRPLLMNRRLDTATLEAALSDAGAKAVISDGPVFSVFTLSAAELTGAAAEPLSDTPFGTELFVMSSGTSAGVKVCAYTAEELYYQIEGSVGIINECKQIKKHCEGQLKLLTFLPFYHIFGLTAVYIWFAFFSRTFVQLNDLAPGTIVNTIRRHKVTHIFAVPLFWNKVYEQAMTTIRDRGEATARKFEKGMALAKKLSGVPLLGDAFSRLAFREVRDNLFGDSIRFMITGGSEAKTEVLEFFNTIGYPLANGYGMTEIGITSVELSPRRKIRIGGSVGHPMSSVEYAVSGEGELLVRGRAMARYILENGVRTENDGWFATRDLARCEKGRYYILGRRDDVVISQTGENLNPNLVEPRFGDLPGLREVCLIKGTERETVIPTLLCSMDPAIREARFDALQAQVRERLAALGLAAQINRVVFTARPLMGPEDIKLNRRTIAAAYARGEFPVLTGEVVRAAASDGELARQVRDIFARSLNKPAEQIGDDYDFFTDGGGTSLDYFGALSLFQSEMSVTLPVTDGQSLSTVSEICRYIKDLWDR